MQDYSGRKLPWEGDKMLFEPTLEQGTLQNVFRHLTYDAGQAKWPVDRGVSAAILNSTCNGCLVPVFEEILAVGISLE